MSSTSSKISSFKANNFSKLWTFLSIIIISGCAGYLKYPVDEFPHVPFDTSLSGIWISTEDTDRLNFVLVQPPRNEKDILTEIRERYGSISNYLHSLQDSGLTYQDNGFVDTTECIRVLSGMNSRYANVFHLTYVANSGTSPKYHRWASYLSKLGNDYFINIQYYHIPFVNDSPDHSSREDGFLVSRIIKKSNDTIISVLVSYPHMRELQSSREVKKALLENLLNVTYFHDTFNFYKVKKGEFTVNEAIKQARWSLSQR